MGKRTHRPDDDFIPVTVDEFFAMPDDPRGRTSQLVNGDVQLMAPASPLHNLIQGNVYALIRQHLKARQSPCTPLLETGVSPRLGNAFNVRVPDLLVTCDPISADDRIVTNPVLVIEILSPGNRSQTLANVYAYSTIPSVQEILVIHSRRINAELYRRDDAGIWPQDYTEIIGRDGQLTPTSIHFSCPLVDLYEGTTLIPH